MKMNVREQFICCLLAVILFLSGMCVEIPHADASFLYAKEASFTSSNGSVISDGSRLTKPERVCTIDAFRRDVTTYLSGNRGRSLEKRFLRSVVALVAVAILLSYFFLSYGMANTAFMELVDSHATIVRYIQQKDGKK